MDELPKGSPLVARQFIVMIFIEDAARKALLREGGDNRLIQIRYLEENDPYQSRRVTMLNSKINKSLIAVFCLCLLIVGFGKAYAQTAVWGVRACGGNHFQRTTQNEKHTTSYGLRNFDFNETIVISRIIIVDSNGNVLFNGLPGTSTFKSILSPFQSTSFNTSDVLTSFLPKSERPIQTYIVWYTGSGNPAQSLGGGGNRLVRDSTTGKEISRHGGGCRNLDL
jgi:hypothetical protein